MAPLADIRKTYLNLIVGTRTRFQNFRFWSRETKRLRQLYRQTPTRENYIAYRHAKRMRAIRLRTFRKSRARRQVAEIRYKAAKKAARRPLRLKAYDEAMKLVGVTEQGGNNRGAEVEEIIREGGGLPGQAWCGFFMAAVYKRAGSKSVSWHWGAVRLMAQAAGVVLGKIPLTGFIVRYTFDHTGMFVHYCDAAGNRVSRRKATHILAVEANTGDSGAVSDSKTGGDGVKVKIRSLHLVKDYLKVIR